MEVISVISTKGNVGKTTVETEANLGTYIADAVLSISLLDMGMQHTLLSFYVPCGVYEQLSASTLEVIRSLSQKFYPQWHEQFVMVTGKTVRGAAHV
ncbi:hypothetical protein HGO41_13985 [Rahnella sp. CG8]|uniref:ParA family protein n=1 Tax=Yersiniaceae TaxID=1903411 RepID=UPI001013C821|nr:MULTISPECIES: hypothetical protein [Yersiniaceae]MCM2446270.1 hypothetical protein [Rahnella sp. CG8]